MLRPGSKFKGTQQSDASRYSVEVDIKTVDMSESSICGYLKIDGEQPIHKQRHLKVCTDPPQASLPSMQLLLPALRERSLAQNIPFKRATRTGAPLTRTT